ncbi:hypothetical protein, partial [Listeria seeligeri]|uniref:hypothetical protein n=1 Tax=Listeria seeligeri TaxID=1640 RepID=UPI0022EBA56F
PEVLAWCAPLLAPSRLRLDAPQSSPLAGVAQLPGSGAGRAPAWAGAVLDADVRAVVLLACAAPLLAAGAAVAAGALPLEGDGAAAGAEATSR